MHKLIVVGSGIKTVAHITEETRRVIQNADKVLYLVNEDNLKSWIAREAKDSESLDPIYFSAVKRIDAYHQITTYIVEQYKKLTSLCVVFYGHPTVFADSALKAVKLINSTGGDAVILPAISSMDCLFSDLQIDPGDHGCFSIDATELLLFERSIDTASHVILWQIANFGTHDTQATNKLSVLVDYLLDYYSEEQQVGVYQAAILPMQKPQIEWSRLKELTWAIINPISTLYIAPAMKKKVSEKYVNLLEIDIKDYQLSIELNIS